MHAGLAAGPELISSCTCPGYNVTYTCTAVGGIATVWRGSAFRDCPNNMIILRHSSFMRDEGAFGVCNDGRVIGHDLNVTGNNYISQLQVVYSADLEGRTVECAFDNRTAVNVLGTLHISMTSSMYTSCAVKL